VIQVGVIGCGTIGKTLAQACQKRFSKQVTLRAIADTDSTRARRLQKSLNPEPRILSPEALIRQCDLIVEAASQSAAGEIAMKALALGKDVLVMSVGGLLGHERRILDLARAHRCCLYVPSGGIVGIDGLKAAKAGRIRRVSLTTRKPPAGLEHAPYVVKKGISLRGLKVEKIVFEGNAAEAVKAFPKNINVSATLSLAALGAKKTDVKIIAVPGAKKNVHEVTVEGEFGSFYARTENVPSAENPKTSLLAILSALATLERILSNVKIGT